MQEEEGADEAQKVLTSWGEGTGGPSPSGLNLGGCQGAQAEKGQVRRPGRPRSDREAAWAEARAERRRQGQVWRLRWNCKPWRFLGRATLLHLGQTDTLEERNLGCTFKE